MKSTQRKSVVVNPDGDITKTQFSKRKTPCFNFFSSDFLVETLMMNYEEKGRYIQLLCILHTQGHLSWRDTAEIIGKEGKIWALLEKDEQGFYFSERLQYEIDKREAYRKSRQENITKRYEKEEAEKHEKEFLKQIEEVNKKFKSNTSLLTQNGESADEPEKLKSSNLYDPFEEKDRAKNATYVVHMGNGNGNGNRNENVFGKGKGNINNIELRAIEKNVLEYYIAKTGRIGSNMSHVIVECIERGYSESEMKLIINYCCEMLPNGMNWSLYDILAEDTDEKLKQAQEWRNGRLNKKI